MGLSLEIKLILNVVDNKDDWESFNENIPYSFRYTYMLEL